MESNRQQAYIEVSPFIDGQRRGPSSANHVALTDPSTGRVSYDLPAGSEHDVDLAVRSARAAFDRGGWSRAAPSERKRLLHRFAELILERSDELDRLDGLDMGKPVGELFANAATTGRLMQFHAEATDKIEGTVYTSDDKSLVIQRRVPRGVVAAIAPWNFPTFVAGLKIAPALATGNSVVLKPSEQSSMSAMLLASLAVEAGLPPGVLNVVPGLGQTVGKALGLHPDVDMITFTGSTAIGALMQQYAGQSNMKVVIVECGGKSPHIVFDDGIDIEGVAGRIARLLLTNQGQVCSVGSRILVQRSLEPRLVESLGRHLQGLRMGDALDPETRFGPISSPRQYQRVLGYIGEGKAGGAELVFGGRPALEDSGGYFIEPALFRNVDPRSPLAQEEIFGPVLSVIPFDDEDEAVRLANGTIYGLIAYAWTRDLSRGMRLMKSIPSSIRVNASVEPGEGSGFSASNEPYRQSGIGTEGGLAGMESYTRRQLVSFTHE